MKTLESLIQEGLPALGLSCNEDMLRRFRLYFEALEESGKVMNLTAIHGEEDVTHLHFLDCAALLSLADFHEKAVFDIGTGAGFPGLVLKICDPTIHLTLLDSLDNGWNFCGQPAATSGFLTSAVFTPEQKRPLFTTARLRILSLPERWQG